MYVYQERIKDILAHGNARGDRTGTGTIGIFGTQDRFNLQGGFPILTTKKVSFKNVATELLWFLSGNTSAAHLRADGCTIWDEWATAEKCAKFGRHEDDLGPVYGHQWRNFGASKKIVIQTIGETMNWDGDHQRWVTPGYESDGFDQISWVIDEIKNNPNSRRLIVSGWNPAEANKVALPPCHTMFQFYVQGGQLSCHLYARSIDTGLGQPYNIASYALLTHMVAHVCDLTVGEFIMTIGDHHIYSNHEEALTGQLDRIPYNLPKLTIKRKVESIFDFKLDDFELEGYQHHPAIKMDVAI